MIVYQSLSHRHADEFKIVWATESLEYARLFSSEENIRCYQADPQILHLDFSSFYSIISTGEFLNAISEIVLDRFEQRLISRNTDLEISEKLMSIRTNKKEPVWRHVQKRKVIEAAGLAGFNCVAQKEGTLGSYQNTQLLGFLNLDILEPIKQKP